MRVGILALQGSFAPHAQRLAELGHEPRLLRRADDFDGLTHLVLPGGESTTFRHLMDLYGMTDPLVEAFGNGLKIMATCAGAILIGRDDGNRPTRLGLLDVDVERNAYGSQTESFVQDVPIDDLGDPDFHAIFIRAPRFLNLGPDVRPLAFVKEHPVAVEQDRILALAFHPELTDDLRLHERFLSN